MLTNAKPNASSFEAEANEVGFRLRRVLAELAASVRIDMSQPRLAARELGIDKTLVWKVSKITTGTDPIAAMWVLPGTSSQKTLLRAFESAGAPEALLRRAKDAMEEFEKLVEDHAGDRETFEVLLASISEGEPEAHEAWRKAAFQANSALWGVQCRVRSWTYIIAPSVSEPSKGDLGIIGSYIGMRRLRRDAEWPLAPGGVVDEQGKHIGPPIYNLLPSQKDVRIDPSLPEYCRGEQPAIRIERRAGGALEYRMQGGAVGSKAAFDWVAGFRYKNCVTRWKTAKDVESGLAFNIVVPTELVQLDVLVHRKFWEQPPTRFNVYSLLPGEPLVPQPGVVRRELKIHQSVDRLGDGLPGLAVHDVPEYAGMVEAAIHAMGHAPTAFMGSRVRIKYPILSTALVLTADLPEKPGGAGAAE